VNPMDKSLEYRSVVAFFTAKPSAACRRLTNALTPVLPSLVCIHVPTPWTRCSLPTSMNASQTFDAIHLLKTLDISWAECDRIHAVFNIFDTDNDSGISPKEFLQLLGSELTGFASAIFCALDRDGNREMDFAEFLGAVTLICTASQENLCRFAFRMIDADHSGRLNQEELGGLIKELYGDGDGAQTAMDLILASDMNKDMCLSTGFF
jgi:Ca2+-binding EF-hand superfamily protein